MVPRQIGVLICALGMACGQQVFEFKLPSAAEVVAGIDMSSPGSDWSRHRKEAAIASIALDGRIQQQIVLYGGVARHRYSVFLGALAQGSHSLSIERDVERSSAEAGLVVHEATLHEYRSGDAEYDILANAPVLFARSNTVGRFSDVPLVSWCERLIDSGRPVLQYTVIFSNEDGGTSTRALMARWGRTTDIEYVYRFFPNERRATIQARGHKETEFTGAMERGHPLLIPVTDNNMVSGEGSSALRFQLAPVIVDLAGHSREHVMDLHPVTWRVMARELERENKLRPFGAVDGEKISDPRNYLYLEANIANAESRLVTLVRLREEARWRSSALGRVDYGIERDGWIRTAIELPPGTAPSQVAEIGFECLVTTPQREQPPPVSGTCRVREVSKAFFLERDYRPGTSFWQMKTPVEIPSGQVLTWTLK